jgi:hypothetical protein
MSNNAAEAAYEAAPNGQLTAQLWSGLLSEVEDGVAVNDVLSEMTRIEIAMLVSSVRPNAPLLRTLKNAAGNDVGGQVLPAINQYGMPADMLYADLVTAVASPGQCALPASGMIVNTRVSATNGLSSWYKAIVDPTEFVSNPTNIFATRLPPADELFCTLAIISAHLRCAADETVRRAAVCPGFEELMAGNEPGAAPVVAQWSEDDSYHCTDVFGDKYFKPAKSQLAETRGCRQILWPALTAFVGDREVCSPPSMNHIDTWELCVAFSALQQEMMTGIDSSIGGGFNNRRLITHIVRNGKGLLNLNIPDSDIDRANRLHLCALMVGLSGHSVTMHYKMTYKDEYMGEMNEYYMSAGTYRACRNECTSYAGETCSNLQWMVTLPQQQLVVAGFDAIAAGALVKGTPRQIGVVCAPNWFAQSERVLETFNVAALSPMLIGGDSHALMALRRRKSALPGAGPAPAGANQRPSGHERLMAYISAYPSSFGRLLWPCKQISVPTPWEEVGRQKDVVLHGDMIVNETGANRYTAKLAIRAGLDSPASVVANAMEQENKQQAVMNKQAENAAPVNSDATVAALMAKVAAMEQTMRALTEATAKKGADMDDTMPGPAQPARDALAQEGNDEPQPDDGIK